MSDSKFQRMVKSLPSLYKAEVNTYIRGLLQAWGLLDDQITVEIQNTKEQLFVETAQARNLDRLGSNVGVTRSSELGIDDGDFRGLVPVLSYYPKQVRRTIISLLDVFWGEGFTRPNISSGNTETFNFGPETALTGTLTFKKGELIVRGVGTNFTGELQPGDYIKPSASSGLQYAKVSGVIDDTTLQLSIEWDHDTTVNVAAQKGTIQTLIYKVDNLIEKTIRFIPDAFEDLTAVTLDELVTFLNGNIEHNPHLTASVFLDPVLGSKLNLRTNTPGLRGSIQILGGTANDPLILNFAADVATETRAKVIEVNPNEIVVQIPSSVPVLRRSLKGSAHPRDTKAMIASNREVFNFSTVETGELLRSTFTSGTTADFAAGSTTGTLSGGGTIVADKFVTGGSGGRIDYPLTSNFSPNVGAIRFKFTPNFNGQPPGSFHVPFHWGSDSPFLANSMFVNWSSTGTISFRAYNSAGGLILGQVAGSYTGAVLGVEEEWEFNYDIPGGAMRLFINGNLVASHFAAFVGTQNDPMSSGSIRLGNSRDNGSPINGTFDDLQMFDSVQHTTNFASEIPRTLGSKSLDLTVDGSPYSVIFTDSNFENPAAATAIEVANTINSQLLFLKASVGSGGADNKRVTLSTTEGSSQYQVTGGTANDILGFSTLLQEDPDLIDPTFPSAYLFDPIGQLFTVTGTNSELSTPIVAGDVSATLNLANASSFPNLPGKFILDFGKADQEGPISYTSRPNNSTLLIDASYQFQKSHAAGRKVNFIVNTPSIPRITGDDYAFTVTGTEEARQAAQDLIKKLLASGVVIRFIIDFPEFLFECVCRDCGPSESPDYIGSRSGSGPLVF